MKKIHRESGVSEPVKTEGGFGHDAFFPTKFFDAVARQGSFNKAAQQLHLTPSAISHAIAVMEEELGFALFNRGKNGVSMTSYGASLYPSIRDVLNSDEALKQSIARLNGLEKGKVKLGVFNSVCASLLPGLLKSFAAHYPQIEIEVYQAPTMMSRNGCAPVRWISLSCPPPAGRNSTSPSCSASRCCASCRRTGPNRQTAL